MMEGRNSSYSYFGDWCLVTTCGGVVDWYKATTTPRKVFWFLLVTTFIVCTSYQLIIGIQDYFTENQYTTSVFVDPQNALHFPNVTICNFNRALKSKIGGIDRNAISYAFGSLPFVYTIPIPYGFNITQFEDAWRQYTNEDVTYNNLKHLLQTIGSDCATTFIRCSWAGVAFSCCSRVMEVVNTYGNCFMISPPITINSTTYPIQRIPGASQGLKVILNPRMQEYPSDTVINNFQEAGFVVSINYLYEPMIPDPITVPIGTHAWISLQAKLETVIPPQIQVYPLPCNSNPQLKILSVPYTKSNCYFDCTSQFMLKYCGCLFFTDTKQNYPVCNVSLNTGCMKSFTDIVQCQSNCLNPCAETLTVETTVSTTKFPSKKLITAIHAVLDQYGFKLTDTTISNAVALDVYFPRLELIRVEKSETTSLITFIANIGGILGIWLGISLLTPIQTLYYFVEWLCSKFRQEIEKQQSPAPLVARKKY